MEIVQFKNGKYGIRKQSFLDKLFKREGVFWDFERTLFPWKKSSFHYFGCCQLDTLEEVEKIFPLVNSSVILKVIK